MYILSDKVHIQGRKKMILMPRDLEILEFLYRFKVANRDQLQREFFENTSLSAFWRRMALLHKVGLIKRAFYEENLKARRYYSLSKKAFNSVIRDNSSVIQSKGKLKSDSLYHDLGLVNIYQMMRNYDNIKAYYSENEIENTKIDGLSDHRLKNLRALKADSLVVCGGKSRDFFFSLEYERTMKSFPRYLGIFRDWIMVSDADAILLICENKGMIEKLKKFEAKEFPSAKPRIFYQTIDHVLEKPSTLIFFCRRGNTLSFSLSSP